MAEGLTHLPVGLLPTACTGACICSQCALKPLLAPCRFPLRPNLRIVCFPFGVHARPRFLSAPPVCDDCMGVNVSPEHRQ